MTRASSALWGTCLATLVAACTGEVGDAATHASYCSREAARRLGSDGVVCFTVQNGRAIFDGDIDLGDATELIDDAPGTAELQPEAISPSRESTIKLWPGGTIRYLISSSFTLSQKQMIEWSIAHFNSFETLTGVRWAKKTSYTTHYVFFRPDPDAASVSHGSSAVGRAGGAQYLNLNFPNMVLHNKNEVGTILHEMGHAAGLLHEQSREDRDQYVTIHPENIVPQYGGQFEKLTGNLFDDIGPYNLSSVMHYAWDNGSIQYGVLPTITKKDGGIYQSGTELGVLSQGDLDALEYLYRTALNPALPFTDSFSREDDIILGPYWRNRTGKIDLVEGEAANVALTYWSVEQLGNFIYGSGKINIEADLEAGEYGAFLVARYNGPGNDNHYYAGVHMSGANGGPRATLRKKKNGVAYELAGVDISSPSGKFRFELQSSTLKLYLNDQLLLTHTDTTFWSGAVGIKLAGSARLDDFSVWQW